MKLKTIGVLLLIAALIGVSGGVVAAEEAEQTGHCEDWEPGRCCSDDPGRDWQNSDGPGRDHDGDGVK
ncbi:MAG: hypothetical protein E4G94_12005 [ANME-2 cluster archaeon]|nr:MAG: hypothetical protein E4G94_12005 [ANME-2 cluster archaeon]